MKPTLYKIGEGERKGLSKDMQEIILSYEEENQTLKDNVEFLHSCLDDRDKSIELLKEKKKSEFGVCWLWLFFMIIYSLVVAVLIKVLPRE